MKTKKTMSLELNALLGLNIDWASLKRGELEAVHRALIEQLTVPRAMNLHATAFRLRLDSMPLISVLRERTRLLREDYQRSQPTIRYPQQPGVPTVLHLQKDFNPPTQPEKQKRIQYIS